MDADRKKVTWEHLYKHVYGSNDSWPICELYDFSNLDESLELNQYGYQIKLKKDITIEDIKIDECNEYKDKIIDFLSQCKNNKYYFPLSGDADFGMKNGTYKIDKEEALKRMHMFPNFSLMPVVGGMNNKKGNFGYRDRFDIFAYYLSEYYITKNINLLMRFINLTDEARENYPKVSGAFLNMFMGVKDYFKKIYLIDGVLVDALIVNGRNSLIQNGKISLKQKEKEDIENDKKMDTEGRYYELVSKYWQQREKKMKELIPKEELWYLYENIEEDKYR